MSSSRRWAHSFSFSRRRFSRSSDRSTYVSLTHSHASLTCAISVWSTARIAVLSIVISVAVFVPLSSSPALVLALSHPRLSHVSLHRAPPLVRPTRATVQRISLPLSLAPVLFHYRDRVAVGTGVTEEVSSGGESRVGSRVGASTTEGNSAGREKRRRNGGEEPAAD